MEKIFGKNQLEQNAPQKSLDEKKGVWLQRQHLWISAEVAEQAFQNDTDRD